VTTMRQDVAAMSQHAVGALVDEIRGTPQPRRELLFHTELVVRGSTGPAPAGPAYPAGEEVAGTVAATVPPPRTRSPS